MRPTVDNSLKNVALQSASDLDEFRLMASVNSMTNRTI